MADFWTRFVIPVIYIVPCCRCLTKWLEHKPTCPMCMAIVSSHYRGHHHHHHHSLATGRITATSFNMPGSLQPPNSFRGIQINQEI